MTADLSTGFDIGMGFGLTKRTRASRTAFAQLCFSSEGYGSTGQLLRQPRISGGQLHQGHRRVGTRAAGIIPRQVAT